MALVRIKTLDGSYIGVARDGRASPRATSYLFHMTRSQSGFTFRAAGGDYHLRLAASGDAIVAADEAPGPDGTFALTVEDAGRVSLRASNGRYVISDGDEGHLAATSAEPVPAALFVIDRLEVTEQVERALTEVRGPCCHADHGDVLWNDETHKMVVELGIGTVLRQHADKLFAKLFFEHFWSAPTYRDAVFKGLYDADYVHPYNQGIYLWHFYDPDTGGTFLPGGWPNARSAGEYYFTKSVAAANGILALRTRNQPVPDALYRDCGYNLGLTLHYLTDLTQPMHAANFTNASLPILAHKAFEDFVEKERDTILRDVPRLSKAELDAIEKRVTEGYFHASSYLHDVAVSAKKIWVAQLWPWIDAGNRDFRLDDPVIASVLDGSTRQAPRAVAGLVFAYMALVRTNQAIFQETKWYQIKEHTKGELMTWTEGGGFDYVARWSPVSDPNRQLFCFVADGVGTYRIVSKLDTDHSWRMIKDSDVRPWYYARVSKVEHRGYTAFYLEHAGLVGGKPRVRIIEPTQEEIITISWGSFDDGRALRWGPLETEEIRNARQTFELVEVSEMTPEEHRRLTDHWRKKIRSSNKPFHDEATSGADPKAATTR